MAEAQAMMGNGFGVDEPGTIETQDEGTRSPRWYSPSPVQQAVSPAPGLTWCERTASTCCVL